MALTVPSSTKAGVGIETAQLCFDAIEFADPPHTFLCNRCRAGASDLDQLTPCMRPTVGEFDVRTDTIRRDQPIISGVAVDLKNARKP